MLSDVAIRVSNLSKCYQIYDKPQDRLKQSLWRGRRQFYREFWALKDVSFEAKKGETIGIIGRNGSGKSTLLQMICGTLTPTNGDINVQGRVTALLELGAGFNPEFTGRENIYMNGAIIGLSQKEIDSRYDDIVAFADIGDFINQAVKTYSSGMYVRLAYAIQAHLDPEIFIVDEALAVGDAYFIHRCMLHFREMQKRGKTILLVTHDSNSVKNVCHRAIWIDQGKLMMSGHPAEVVDRYIAFLFKQPIVNLSSNSTDLPDPEDLNHYNKNKEVDKKVLPPETKIPNIDRRLGDQTYNITGVALYNKSMEPIGVTPNNCYIVVRMTIRNNALPEGTPLVVGYAFRNNRGEEAAVTNSLIDKLDIDGCPIGGSMTVRMRILIPILLPGHYSISPAVAYIVNNGEIVISDRIENGIIFWITSDYNVLGQIYFKTDFEVE